MKQCIQISRHVFINMVFLFGVLLCFSAARVVQAQAYNAVSNVQEAQEVKIGDICQLPPAAYNGTQYLRVEEQSRAMAANKTATANFMVTYVGFGAFPDAQAAFQRAVDTWASLLTSTETINVTANFAPLGTGVLGSAGPAASFFVVGPNGPIPAGHRWVFGVALLEALFSTDVNTAGAADINATFNSTFTDWHFGTGAPPSGLIDFESVVLHELGHGLNFTRFARRDNGSGPVECNGVAGTGCLDIFGAPATLDYGLNDTFWEDGPGNLLRSPGATYTDPSIALGTVFTGGASGLFFNGPLATAQNGATRPRLYSPGTFAAGSSLAHLDNTTFDGTLNALMTSSISFGEVARTPGPVTCALFRDLGWTVDQTTCNNLPLPVELTSFEAVADGQDMVLQWNTASETNNAGFQVEHRYLDGAFESVEFVNGYGTTIEPKAYSYRISGLEPGHHVFRLKQVDYDGTSEYSPEVERTVEIPGSFVLSEAFPNPFNPETRVTLMVARSQQATVDVYDATGRKVAALHNGPLDADRRYEFSFAGQNLASGLYFLRVTGDHFTASRTLTLLK